MFYAIEYAYGSNMINNGNRADRVLAFTRRELRDVWVADGSPQIGPGERDKLTARDRRVRVAGRGLEDGDGEGWRVLAIQRVNASPALLPYAYELVEYDWGNRDHYAWTATEPERTILEWAKAVREAR